MRRRFRGLKLYPATADHYFHHIVNIEYQNVFTPQKVPYIQIELTLMWDMQM